MNRLLRQFGISLALSLVVCAAVLVGRGPKDLLTLLVLIALEIVFSFDNAIVNAKILGRLSRAWQTAFLTVGIVIAIFGMRLLFPLVIVSLTAGLGIGEVWRLALHHPEQYAAHLGDAHPMIAAFGGAFLMLLTLEFFFNGRHHTLWWEGLERRLRRLRSVWLPPCLTLAAVVAVAVLDSSADVLKAGVLGVVIFVVVQGATALLGRGQPHGTALTGWAAFSVFMYLQVLDASFSFDGVIGAFAITDIVLLIAAGLGVGALWVRSLTVYMVRHGLLEEYRYLEHGAYYTIAALSAALWLSIFLEVPDVITGLVGLGIIGSAAVSSHQAWQHHRG